MNKIIPALSIIVLTGCATNHINTTDVSLSTDEAAKPASAFSTASAYDASVNKTVKASQPSTFKHHNIANRGFGRRHTVIPVNKPAEPTESTQQENLIPRIARYIKQGVASWYGKRFHGRKTATGEIFDMYALTAAHKTLPIPSYAQVTNLENNKSIIVRINDRGPYVGNRLLDLSYAAAKKLDIHKEGLAKVEIKALVDEQSLSKGLSDADEQEKNIYLELGTFSNPEKAQNLQNKVAAYNLPEPEILPSSQNDATYFKVQIGPIKSKSSADRIHLKLAKLGINGAQIVTETKKSNHTMIQ
ncbi:MAG: septal ring lytic transglycosylase RlpA family protein [Gammaproteobacteria bacterium]